MPGVVIIYEGAWIDLDENGVDRAGQPGFPDRGRTESGGLLRLQHRTVQHKKTELEHRPGWDKLATARAMFSGVTSDSAKENNQWPHKIDKAKIKAAIKRRKKEVYTPVVPDMQLGFVHNNVDCIGCRACEIACKDKNGLAPGHGSGGFSISKAGPIPTYLPTR